MNKIYKPFRSEIVKALDKYQEDERNHPFTCPNNHEASRILIATYLGWHCNNCAYTQDWAWGNVKKEIIWNKIQTLKIYQ